MIRILSLFFIVVFGCIAVSACNSNNLTTENVVIEINGEVINDFDYYTIQNGTLIVVKGTTKYHCGNYVVKVTQVVK